MKKTTIIFLFAIIATASAISEDSGHPCETPCDKCDASDGNDDAACGDCFECVGHHCDEACNKCDDDGDDKACGHCAECNDFAEDQEDKVLAKDGSGEHHHPCEKPCDKCFEHGGEACDKCHECVDDHDDFDFDFEEEDHEDKVLVKDDDCDAACEKCEYDGEEEAACHICEECYSYEYDKVLVKDEDFDCGDACDKCDEDGDDEACEACDACHDDKVLAKDEDFGDWHCAPACMACDSGHSENADDCPECLNCMFLDCDQAFEDCLHCTGDCDDVCHWAEECWGTFEEIGDECEGACREDYTSTQCGNCMVAKDLYEAHYPCNDHAEKCEDGKEEACGAFMNCMFDVCDYACDGTEDIDHYNCGRCNSFKDGLFMQCDYACDEATFDEDSCNACGHAGAMVCARYGDDEDFFPEGFDCSDFDGPHDAKNFLHQQQ